MSPRKNIVAIFAHPDDESFGPAGTLAQLAKEHDVYLLCATKGDHGENGSDNKVDPLIEIRTREVEAAAKVLGIKEVRFLGFNDGKMCNFEYHNIAAETKKHLEELQPEKVLTFEPQGVSGHIDHITITYVTLFLFEQLDFIKEVWMYCSPHELSEVERKNYFIYMPPGYKKNEVDEVVDVSDVWQQRVQAITQHTSQKKDIESFLPYLENLPKEEYFLVQKR